MCCTRAAVGCVFRDQRRSPPPGEHGRYPSTVMPMYSADRIRLWLSGTIPYLADVSEPVGPNESDPDQSAYHFVAGDYSASALIGFFNLPNITDAGRHEMTLAICDRVEWLTAIDDLPSNVTSEEQRLDELNTLLQFIRDNRDHFDETNDRGMLGVVYEYDVLPLL